MLNIIYSRFFLQQEL